MLIMTMYEYTVTEKEKKKKEHKKTTHVIPTWAYIKPLPKIYIA